MLELPEDLRGAFKDPLGPVFDDPEALLGAAGDPLVAVGDVVTAHLHRAGRPPDVSVVDGRTKRERIDPSVERVLPEADIEVSNPPGMLSRDLLAALAGTLDRPAPTVVDVDGEEDLAALPAIVATPLGGSVVYGQPGEGMVLVTVTEGSKADARALLSRMDGDTGGALALLDDEVGVS